MVIILLLALHIFIPLTYIGNLDQTLSQRVAFTTVEMQSLWIIKIYWKRAIAERSVKINRMLYKFARAEHPRWSYYKRTFMILLQLGRLSRFLRRSTTIPLPLLNIGPVKSIKLITSRRIRGNWRGSGLACSLVARWLSLYEYHHCTRISLSDPVNGKSFLPTICVFDVKYPLINNKPFGVRVDTISSGFSEYFVVYWKLIKLR